MKKSDIELSAIFHSQVSVRILVGTLILLSSILVGTIESAQNDDVVITCLLYTSPSPRDRQKSRMPSSA